MCIRDRQLQERTSLSSEHKSTQFICGVAAGCVTGLATQVLHNAALTAGQLRLKGEDSSHRRALTSLFKTHGTKALWLNFPMRVAVIASFSAVLNVTQPFRD
eukprot:TRINITY_DN15540_c0_g1_i1.p1 TRINITY_DN15540_c0_g1~~TRINITY_DN15540_c0_g1_i1.p1  ORF type:complete len:102 (+),score=10.87 TRINITY_DN15540_c0_g1_i1:139-444(+)